MGAGEVVPAGSLRWDKFVRSSLASSMAGFIKGGRLGSLPVWMASRVVSTFLVWKAHGQHARFARQVAGEGVSCVNVYVCTCVYVHVCVRTSPFSSVKTSVTLSPAICLSVTSEATQPSVVSGCHARVPMS